MAKKRYSKQYVKLEANVIHLASEKEPSVIRLCFWYNLLAPIGCPCEKKFTLNLDLLGREVTHQDKVKKMFPMRMHEAFMTSKSSPHFSCYSAKIFMTNLTALLKTLDLTVKQMAGASLDSTAACLVWIIVNRLPASVQKKRKKPTHTFRHLNL